MRSPFRLALAQTTSIEGDVTANVRRACELANTAADQHAQLVVFPELFLTGYHLAMLERRPEAWLTPNDPRLAPILQLCAQRRISAVLGAPYRTHSGEQFIAAPVVGPMGLIGVSFKQHVHRSEVELFQGGEALPPFPLGGWNIAVGICFDAAFPEHAHVAALGGADLYVGSALYTRGEERRCDLHFGARAMDNRMFTALANYAGDTGGHQSCGLSGVWAPTGEVLTQQANADEALLVFELEPERLAPFREEHLDA